MISISSIKILPCCSDINLDIKFSSIVFLSTSTDSKNVLNIGFSHIVFDLFKSFSRLGSDSNLIFTSRGRLALLLTT